MTIALAILALALVGLLTYRELVVGRDRMVAREDMQALLATHEAERQAAAAERAALLSAHEEERAFHAQERKELYQRIQAPEVAVAAAARDARGPYKRRKPAGHDHDIAVERDGAKEVSGG